MKKKDYRGLSFQKSSFSDRFGCVGVASIDDAVVLTNTKSKESFVEYTREEWKIFIDGVKAGEFDKYGE